MISKVDLIFLAGIKEIHIFVTTRVLSIANEKNNLSID